MPINICISPQNIVSLYSKYESEKNNEGVFYVAGAQNGLNPAI